MSGDITIDLHEVSKFLSDLGALEGVVIPLVHRYMRISVDVIEAEVAGRTPVGATGNLRGSIGTEIRGARLDIVGEVGTAILYGEPAERGRRPGRQPPVDPIEYWVIRKGIAPAGPEARSAAWAIAANIGEFGTEGAHMFELGFEAAEPKVLNLWRGLSGQIAQELARK